MHLHHPAMLQGAKHRGGATWGNLSTSLPHRMHCIAMRCGARKHMHWCISARMPAGIQTERRVQSALARSQLHTEVAKLSTRMLDLPPPQCAACSQELTPCVAFALTHLHALTPVSHAAGREVQRRRDRGHLPTSIFHCMHCIAERCCSRQHMHWRISARMSAGIQTESRMQSALACLQLHSEAVKLSTRIMLYVLTLQCTACFQVLTPCIATALTHPHAFTPACHAADHKAQKLRDTGSRLNSYTAPHTLQQ